MKGMKDKEGSKVVMKADRGCLLGFNIRNSELRPFVFKIG